MTDEIQTARVPGKCIVGLSGNWTRPSKTRTLVNAVLASAQARGLGTTELIDLEDIGPGLRQTTQRDDAPPDVERAIQSLMSADAIVVGSSVYKGAYTGLFKHFFDLFAIDSLEAKPVVLTATGRSPAHASIIDYHLRPLFLFFDAAVVTRGLYALPTDFDESGHLVSACSARVERAVDELARLMQAPSKQPA